MITHMNERHQERVLDYTHRLGFPQESTSDRGGTLYTWRHDDGSITRLFIPAGQGVPENQKNNG